MRVLTGQVCPSGRLPVTFARQYADYPYVKYGAEAYPGVGGQVHYKEGVFVGYRGFEKSKTAPQFPFGFGLSYTTFRYSRPTVSQTADGWTVTVDVTNTGSCEGKETVQLYVGEQKVTAQNPVKQLKDFAKLSLKPGQTATATLHIAPRDLQTWDEQTHQWTMPTAPQRAYIGASSADIRAEVNIALK